MVARTDAEREAVAQKDEAILLLLAKLAVVYWRPDFTAGQAKQLYTQFLDDLREFAFADIAEAIEKYRRDPENKFYPLPGQLRGLIATPYSWDPSPKKHLTERLEAGRLEMQRMVAAIEQRVQIAPAQKPASVGGLESPKQWERG